MTFIGNLCPCVTCNLCPWVIPGRGPAGRKFRGGDPEALPGSEIGGGSGPVLVDCAEGGEASVDGEAGWAVFGGVMGEGIGLTGVGAAFAKTPCPPIIIFPIFLILTGTTFNQRNRV